MGFAVGGFGLRGWGEEFEGSKIRVCGVRVRGRG
jgi:hypothetical protein